MHDTKALKVVNSWVCRAIMWQGGADNSPYSLHFSCVQQMPQAAVRPQSLFNDFSCHKIPSSWRQSFLNGCIFAITLTPRSNCKKIIHFGTRTFRFLAGVKFQHEAAIWSRHHVLFQRAPPATTAFTAWRNCCIYLVWFALCFGFIEWQHLTDHYCFNKT